MQAYFFGATESAHSQITDLFDFVWPTAAAMWNLRWQVAGYLNALPNATVEQLRARFTEGADIHGANLKRACIEHSWEQQKDAFARILLVNTIAIYEGWIEVVLDELGKKTKTNEKSLQFPEPSGTPSTGVLSAIATITSAESKVLKDSFYDRLRAEKNYVLPKLNSMLVCFRFFKELRNCDMHGGGIAGQRLLDAYAKFTTVATPSALGVNEVPLHHPVVIGKQVRLSLRGVVGFSQIVLRIIVTLDAELSCSLAAEDAFVRRWKQTHPRLISLPADGKLHTGKVGQLVAKAGFPRPRSREALTKWLNQRNLLFF